MKTRKFIFFPILSPLLTTTRQCLPEAGNSRQKSHTAKLKAFIMHIAPSNFTLNTQHCKLSAVSARAFKPTVMLIFRSKILSKQLTIVVDLLHKIQTSNIIMPTRRIINPPDKQTKLNTFYIYILSPISFEYLISYQQTLSLVNFRDTTVINQISNLLDKSNYIILHMYQEQRSQKVAH